MSITVATGKGRRRYGQLVMELSVGARANKGLSLTFRNERTGKWTEVVLEAKDADTLRSLIKTADEMGTSKAADALNRAFAAEKP